MLKATGEGALIRTYKEKLGASAILRGAVASVAECYQPEETW